VGKIGHSTSSAARVAAVAALLGTVAVRIQTPYTLLEKDGRDADNPHDKFAVRVEVDGEHVGHLPRGTAKHFGKRLRGLKGQGKKAICMAYVGRGPDHPNLGVSLRIPYDGEILQGKR
jgi:hypothetical protein